MTENEKTTERRLVARVAAAGGWCIKLPATYVTGLPDRLCLLPGGVLFFAELKGPGLKPTKIQQHVHEKIRALGFAVHVLDSRAAVDALKLTPQ